MLPMKDTTLLCPGIGYRKPRKGDGVSDEGRSEAQETSSIYIYIFFFSRIFGGLSLSDAGNYEGK